MSRKIQDIPATAHFDFLHGSYSSAKWQIPYFVTTVSLKDAAEHLHLTSEIPGSEDILWSIDELYQRDINWNRVERQIVPYLRNAEVPQFFNAITIALLPRDLGAAKIGDGFDGADNWNPPNLESPPSYEKVLNVGPITLGFWDDWNGPHDIGFRSGRMRWNKDQVFGVAIDGQHRLAAIKSLASGSVDPAVSSSRVPVIFLLFDERVGFQAPGNPETVEILRRLFIDLNKHSQTVSRGRQILLDDRDPHAVCVRKIVSERLSDTIDSLNDPSPRMPLSLIDWHSEQAKFDTGPYISTVLGLDWAVTKILGTKPISDWTDYNAIGKQIKALTNRLGVNLNAASARLQDQAALSMTPFVYSDEDLREISDAFADAWSPAVIHLLTKFQPYADLVKLRSGEGTLSLQFQEWYRLHEAKEKEKNAGGHAAQNYGKFIQRVSSRLENPIGETTLLARLYKIDGFKRDSLAFNVVFQRALMEALLDYAKFDSAQVNELVPDEDSEPVDFADAEWDIDDLTSNPGEAVVDSEDVPSGNGSAKTANRTHEIKLQTESRVIEYIRSLNRIISAVPDLLNIEMKFELPERAGTHLFWLGSLRKFDGGIDFTQSASARAKDVLFISAAMCLYDDRLDPDNPSDFDKFWSECRDPNGPAVCRAVYRALLRQSSEQAIGGRILKSRQEEYNCDAAEEELYWRFRYLWESVGL